MPLFKVGDRIKLRQSACQTYRNIRPNSLYEVVETSIFNGKILIKDTATDKLCGYRNIEKTIPGYWYYIRHFELAPYQSTKPMTEVDYLDRLQYNFKDGG